VAVVKEVREDDEESESDDDDNVNEEVFLGGKGRKNLP